MVSGKPNTQVLMSDISNDSLEHYGVKGMRWGVRKDRRGSSRRESRSSRNRTDSDRKTKKRGGEPEDPKAVARRVNAKSDKAIKEINEKYRKLGVINAENNFETSKGSKAYHKELTKTLEKIYKEEGIPVIANEKKRERNTLFFTVAAAGLLALGLSHSESGEKRLEVALKVTRDSDGYVTGVDNDAFVSQVLAKAKELSADAENTLAQTSISEAEDYLEHYGVKGMKWGVRKNRKTGLIKPGSVLKRAPLQRRDDLMKATATKSLHTRATFQDQSDQLKKIYKSARPKIKAGLKKLNADSKYAGVNLNEKSNKKLREAYNKEVSRVVTDQLNAASYVKTKRKDPFAISFEYRSGVSEKPIVSIAINDKKMFRDANRKWAKETRKSVKHSEDDSVVKFELVLDKNGLITDLVELTSMKQSNNLGSVLMSDLDEDYLEHYGIKGMRWGVRRSRSAKAKERREKGEKPKRRTSEEVARDKVKKAKRKAKTEVKIAKVQAKKERQINEANSQKTPINSKRPVPASQLTNQQLQDVITRNNLEKQYNAIAEASKPKSASEMITSYATKKLTKAGDQAVDRVIKNLVNTSIDSIIEGDKKKKKD